MSPASLSPAKRDFCLPLFCTCPCPVSTRVWDWWGSGRFLLGLSSFGCQNWGEGRTSSRLWSRVPRKSGPCEERSWEGLKQKYNIIVYGIKNGRAIPKQDRQRPKTGKFLNAIWIPVLFPNFWVVSIDFFLVSFMPFSYNWVYERRSSQLRLLFWCFRMSNDKSEHSTTRNISSVLRWHSKPVTHILPAYNGDLKNRLVWHSACVRLSYGLLFKCCI